MRGYQGQYVKEEVAKVVFNHLKGGVSGGVGAVQHRFALGIEEEEELRLLMLWFQAGQELGWLLCNR